MRLKLLRKMTQTKWLNFRLWLRSPFKKKVRYIQKANFALKKGEKPKITVAWAWVDRPWLEKLKKFFRLKK